MSYILKINGGGNVTIGNVSGQVAIGKNITQIIITRKAQNHGSIPRVSDPPLIQMTYLADQFDVRLVPAA